MPEDGRHGNTGRAARKQRRERRGERRGKGNERKMLTKAEISKFFKDRAILRDMELTLEGLKDLKPEELPDAARARMERDLKAEIAEEWARMEPAAEEMRAIAKRIPGGVPAALPGRALLE